MNNQTDYQEIPNVLYFDGKPIRIENIDCVPHFFLGDICSAVGWSAFAARQANSRLFPPFGKIELENGERIGPDEFLTYLSPTGVFYFANLVDAARGQKITAWAKREARRLCPDHPQSDPSMFLKLVWVDKMPPRPLKFSGWRSEWYDLKDAHHDAICSNGDIEALKAGDQDYPEALEWAKANVERDRLLEKFAAAEAALKLEGAN